MPYLYAMPETKLPVAFESQMLELLGKAEFEQFRKAINNTSRTSIRVNPSKTFSLSWPSTPIAWSKTGFFLEERPAFTLDPSIHAGAYYVQEASSMFIEHILHSLHIPKGIYLDLAAAPGGKSTLLSSYLGDEGMLIANEVIQPRAQILKENIIKWGLGNAVVTNNDPEHFGPLEGFFDLVLVDAPCSGEGMFRKDAQAREEWSLDNVQLCSARQKRIMDQAGALVKADGYLVYSTCTFNEQENEDMIRFLTEEFSYEPVRIPLDAGWNIRETSVDSDGKTFYGYRFFPHLVEGEGFFITVLKRSAEAYIQEPKRVKDFKHPYLKEIWNRESSVLDEELGFDGSGKYYTLNDSYFRISIDWNLHFQKISQHMSLKYFGVELGKKQKNDWIPSHEWAVSVLPKNNFPTHELSEAEAVEFLRKNDLVTDNFSTGWVLMTYKNLPLGWIKNLGNRVNNYYPKEWRIRM
ncbi:16S rRNA C967 or C1407 C5-methylase (RsmB/RsmF family)/NOL1/NOP2/fmu family ribosome biogenesis protein [Algoriphagus sp. 4150]|uniref:methyltransferase RsmF C-terminal domain-like protein n=1 Tax=Algoriphagus sp. 4150 TaxID=2817756 RepID=UPI002861C73F|nr:tRNA/rRNA cytosine-C5-methylase [Algoriphagus sp. 4150]MDR7128651.1 16S rRNA C967 or C1407 C5-methylase (RsmB/RsmF family)/NOL1/NOP2/fmu family ribosome biogenesis protein [Algoriphagus sp. 4150]